MRCSVRLLLCAVGVWLLAISSPAGAGVKVEQFPIQDFEIEAYRADFGVSEAVARERLETQHLGLGIVRQLRADLGSEYAGVWFDNRAGEFVVPLLPDAPERSVETALDSAQLQDDYRLTDARYSWDELRVSQRELSENLGSTSTYVETAIDPKTNALVVLDGASSPKTDAELRSAAAETDAKVEIRHVSDRVVSAEPQQCAEFEGPRRVCDRPLRAGVAMDSQEDGGGEHCTAGFKMANALGNFFLTAGHCIYHFGDAIVSNTPKWWSYHSNKGVGGAQELGLAAYWEYPGEDYAAIQVYPSSYWEVEPGWPSQVVYWQDSSNPQEIPVGSGTPEVHGTNPNIPITNESHSWVGLQVCHSGTASGSSCGTVVEVEHEHIGEPVINGPTPHTYHTVRVTGSRLCGLRRDSGGPVWTGSVAVGIHVAGASGQSCPNGEIVYTEVPRATAHLYGLHVGPYVSGPPQVVTEGLSSPGDGHTLSVQGNVNPNGGATTYYVQYGLTEANLDKKSQSYAAGSGYGGHTVIGPMENLTPGTTYYYRFVAVNSVATSFGKTKKLENGAVPPGTSTGPATEVGDAGATLTGRVNPENAKATYYFEWGPTLSYGFQTPAGEIAAGTTEVSVQKALTGLEFGQLYHYRLVARNAANGVLISYGQDRILTPGWYPKTSPAPGGSTGAGLADISCFSPVACLAVGSQDTAAGPRAMAMRWDGTGWSLLTPKNPANTVESRLTGVSCPTASFCEAVGSQQTSGGAYLPFAESWAPSDSWTLQTMDAVEGRASLSEVSCGSATECVAVGSTITAFSPEATKTLAFRWTAAGGSWKWTTTSSPGIKNHLDGLSCPVASSCVAVGSQSAAAGEWRGMALLWNGSSWSSLTPNHPSGSDQSFLTDVSCPLATDCVVTGHYQDAVHDYVPLIERRSSGAWSTLAAARPEGSADTKIESISCVSGARCMAVGTYRIDESPNVVPFAEALVEGAWRIQGPPGGSLYSGNRLEGVSCLGPTDCLAVGEYPTSASRASMALRYFREPPSATTKPATGVSQTGATFVGAVNPNGLPTKHYFEYGTSPSFGSKTAEDASGSGSTQLEFTRGVGGLTPSTDYYYRVVAVHEKPTETVPGEALSFRTPGPPGVRSPSATPNPTTGQSAQLNAQVNPSGFATSYQFEYGTTTSYGSKVPAAPVSVGTGTTWTGVGQTVSGLIPGTTYYYRVSASNSAGTTAGAEGSFTTPAQPTVSLGTASEITQDTARISGVVTPRSLEVKYQFEYGTTTSYGSKVPAAPAAAFGMTPQTVEQQLSGLLPSTTYHYRLRADSPLGSVSTGDGTFKTLAPITLKRAGVTLEAGAQARLFSSNLKFEGSLGPRTCAETELLGVVVKNPGAHGAFGTTARIKGPAGAAKCTTSSFSFEYTVPTEGLGFLARRTGPETATFEVTGLKLKEKIYASSLLVGTCDYTATLSAPFKPGQNLELAASGTTTLTASTGSSCRASEKLSATVQMQSKEAVIQSQ